MTQASLTELLRPTSAPAAVTFVDAAPPGVPHVSPWSRPAAGGTWRCAAAGGGVLSPSPTITSAAWWGRSTAQRDPLAAEKQEMMGLVQTMAGLSNLKMEDVAAHPDAQDGVAGGGLRAARRRAVPPDVALVRGNARQLMPLAEAVQAAGVAACSGTMAGRPARGAAGGDQLGGAPPPASGRIGNRVYTGADDTEGYFAIPRLQLGAVEEKLAVIVRANQDTWKKKLPPRARRRDAPTN